MAAALNPIQNGESKEIISAKGPVFATAIIAGVMAAKSTASIIPFCHPILLESIDVNISLVPSLLNNEADADISIECTVRTTGKTGVEMEAMVGASTAALCVYDMLKGLSHDITIGNVQLVHKSGGKTTFNRSCSLEGVST